MKGYHGSMNYGKTGNRWEAMAPSNGDRAKTIGGTKSTAFHDSSAPGAKSMDYGKGKKSKG